MRTGRVACGVALLLSSASPILAFIRPVAPSRPAGRLYSSRAKLPPVVPPQQGFSSHAKLWEPVLYQGPTPEGGEVKNREAAAVLEEYNLILEVGESVAVPGERGLFIRTTGPEIVEEVTVPWGSLLCGYGEGEVRTSPGGGDKSVLFRMPSADMAVFFNRELVPLWEVLAEGCPEGTGLLGHDVTVDDKGRLDVAPTQGGEQYYFVPREGIPDKVAFVGLFANDLAISGPSPPSSREAYDEASQGSNIGGLVWRVEYDALAKMLKPSRPVVTFLRTLSFRNSVPMELGLHYGYDSFWKKALAQEPQQQEEGEGAAAQE